MKKMILGFLVLVAILMATSTAWAQDAPKVYDIKAVEDQAIIAISRFGQAERDLAAKKTEVDALKTDLATLKASRSASAGAIRRAKEALAAKVAEFSKLEKQLAGDDAGVQKKALTTGENIVRVHLSAPDVIHADTDSTDPVAAATAVATAPSPGTPAQKSEPLARRCPKGTSPRSFVAVGKGGTMGSYFACDPIIKSMDLTAPAKMERTMPLWLKYTAFIASGAVVGGSATYLINVGNDGNTDGSVTATAAAIGGIVGVGVCAVTELL